MILHEKDPTRGRLRPKLIIPSGFASILLSELSTASVLHTIYTYHIYIPLLSSYPSCASILTDIHHDNSYRRYHPRQEAPHRSSRLWPNGPTTRCQCTYCQLNLPHLGLTLLVHFLTLLKYQRSYKTTTLRPKAPQAHHSSRSRRRRRSFPHRCQMG